MRQEEHKKLQERIILDHFISTSGLLKGWKVRDSESPDFILASGRHRTLGVELVSIPGWSLKTDDQTAAYQKDLIESVLSAMSAKEEKLRLYQKKRLDNYWLIIWSDYLENIPDAGAWQQVFGEQSFRRVFLFSLFQPLLIELT